MKGPFTLQPLTAFVGLASFVVLFAGNWILLGHSNRLQSALKARSATLAPKEGVAVPVLKGWTLEGAEISVNHTRDQRQTVMLVFSTDCSIAHANWPTWKALAEQIDMSRFRIVYVNLSRTMTDSYLADHYMAPGSEIVANVDAQSIVDYSLSLSPMVLLFDNQSTVKEVWLGMTKAESQKEMEILFNVDLPDLPSGVI